uniref:Phorbol-ester/DAG-type domain-containing protein n=1 Tax=Panagrolaimus sp. PS1159 TaxID=55785 RepID=A0AC35F782_9BILA
RKVSEADLRSVNKKQLPLILQIFYESGNKNSSRCGSTFDLNLSSISNSGDSVRNYTDDDVSLHDNRNGGTSIMDMSIGGERRKKQQHDFIEVSYHTSTSCDFCKRSMSSIFRNIVAFECKRCHQKYHKEHIEKNEVPSCKCMFELPSKLYMMADSEDQAKIWYNTLLKLINIHSTVMQANRTNVSSVTQGLHFAA